MAPFTKKDAGDLGARVGGRPITGERGGVMGPAPARLECVTSRNRGGECAALPSNTDWRTARVLIVG